MSLYVPKVDYCSLEEYYELQQKLIVEYKSMVTKGLDIKAHMLGRMLEYHGGLCSGVIAHWDNKGSDLWMKFTKQNGEYWCKTVNSSLVALLAGVCSTAWKVISLNRKRHSDVWLYNTFHDLLMNAIGHFIGHAYQTNLLEDFEQLNKWCLVVEEEIKTMQEEVSVEEVTEQEVPEDEDPETCRRLDSPCILGTSTTCPSTFRACAWGSRSHPARS